MFEKGDRIQFTSDFSHENYTGTVLSCDHRYVWYISDSDGERYQYEIKKCILIKKKLRRKLPDWF